MTYEVSAPSTTFDSLIANLETRQAEFGGRREPVGKPLSGRPFIAEGAARAAGQ